MKQIFKNKRVLGVTVVLWVALLFAYNNCAGQKFSFSPTQTFNPVNILDIDCQQVVEVTLPADGSPLHVPARTDKGICFTLKLVSAKAYNPSSKNPDRDGDVISADHDKGETLNSHPYNLGEKVVNLFLEGPRSIKLAGSPDGLSEIKVDNYILVGIAPTTEIYDPIYYKAYGTSDCRIHNVPTNAIGITPPYNNTEGIAYLSYNDYPVLLTPFATGGTASVTPFRVDGDMKTNRSYSLDFRALDCGGIAVTSDIYLSFE